MINKEQLKEILKDLTEIGKEIVDNEIIFQEACNYQRFLMENNQGNKEKVDSGVTGKGSDKVELASDKQIALLKQLGKFKEGLAKQEAWAIINNSKKKNQNY